MTKEQDIKALAGILCRHDNPQCNATCTCKKIEEYYMKHANNIASKGCRLPVKHTVKFTTLYDTLKLLRDAEWMVSPDWSGSNEREALLKKVDKILAQVDKDNKEHE